MKLRIPYMVAAVVTLLALANITTEKGLNAAADLTLTSLDGERLNVRKPASQLMLVNFWSTSCSICVRELATLKALDSGYSENELEIVGITRPYDELDQVMAHITEKDIQHPVVMDPDGSIASAFPGVRFTPTSFLVDTSGTIIWSQVGQMDQQKMISLIDHQIGKSPAQPKASTIVVKSE